MRRFLIRNQEPIILLSCAALAGAALACSSGRSVAGSETTPAAVEKAPPEVTVTVTVDAAKIERKLDRHRLLGSNVAGWYLQKTYSDERLKGWVRELGPIQLRLPGGSWSNGTFWNGNGVRRGNQVDYSKLNRKPYSKWSAPWGTWEIDYSDYAPGFLVNVDAKKPDTMFSTEWHGHVDVKTMHDYIRDVGGEPFVIVNGGSGSPRDAAEWVRWANKKMGYGVRYWEVGNELGGSWEVGYHLPDGSKLNGQIYSRRYAEFARAMKAVDPTIKVGTMDHFEDVLGHCGELVDFVSIHTYPVGIAPVQGAMTDEEIFAKLGLVAEDMEKTRALLRRYQPERADEIEISYTEWNAGFPDRRGALWHAGWVGEMFRHGTDFANQWNLFDMTAGGDLRWSGYWGFWLWSQAMGNTLISTALEGSDRVTAYATRSDNGVEVMAINQSAEAEVGLRVNLEGIIPAARGQQVRFTAREYLFLDHEVKKAHPIWNTGPSIVPFQAGTSFTARIPPASVVVFTIPEEGKRPLLTETKAPKAKEPKLELWFPPEIYAGDRVQAWAYVQNGDDKAPYPLPLADAEIRITGIASATADRGSVGLSDAAGQFFIQSEQPGEATVELRSGQWSGSRRVVFKSSVPRPRIFWDFEDKQVPGFMRSHWKLSFDGTVRPNEQVARIQLAGDIPKGEEKRELLTIGELPGADKLSKKNIRGVTFDVRLSIDFACDDPDAYIEVVTQSPANWWMPLGRIKLSELRGKDWQTKTVLTDDPKHIGAMPGAMNLWFTLHAEKPVHGSIFLDRAGLMVR
jgi:hypothetical protein